LDSSEKIFKKLVESYMVDAVDWFDPKTESKASRGDVDAFLKVIADSKTENHKSVGMWYNETLHRDFRVI
jgi:hypothetical protein